MVVGVSNLPVGHLGGLSPRHRPGHHLDARHRVRCRAHAGRVRAAGIHARSIRRRARSSTIRRKSGRRRSRPCAPPWRRPAPTRSDDRGDRHHQPARDHDRLGSRHRQADPQRHRLAGPPHRRRLRRAAAAGPRAADRARAPACCSIRISPPPRSPGCSTMSTARARRRSRAGSPSARSTASCCGG